MRHEPLGVAFVGAGMLNVCYGRAADEYVSDFQGFSQLHDAHRGLSVYASNFGWGKQLIAQFAFQEDYPPPARPWLGFVTLAAQVQWVLDHPGDFAGFAVLKPLPITPRSLGASIKLP